MMSAAIILTIAAFTAFILKKCLDNRKNKYYRLSFPPGPKPWPIIGNALELPTSAPWVSYAKWGKVYGMFTSLSLAHLFIVHTGDIIYASALGNHIVIVNSEKIAVDLCEKRSTIYSSKPRIPSTEL